MDANNVVQKNYELLRHSLETQQSRDIPDFRIGEPLPMGFEGDPIFILVVDSAGELELKHSPVLSVSGVEQLEAVAERIATESGDRGVVKEYYLRYLVSRDGGLTRIAFLERSDEVRQIRMTVTVSAIAAVTAIGVFFVISIFLSRWVVRPVEKSWQQQRQFVADASHELKTPLTVTLANLNILKSRPDSAIREQMDWILGAESETQRIQLLVDDLLFLAHHDEMAERAYNTALNLSDLVTKAALDFEAVAFEAGMQVDMQIAPNIQVLGDAEQLKQLVGILLDNAGKYSSKGSTIKIILETNGGETLLSVCNEGSPLSLEDQEHIFDRFYRADQSRSKGGYGLGLSIAKAIV